MLEAEGQLRRTDAVGEHLPLLSPQLRAPTLDQLIRHTSGLPDYIDLARLALGPAFVGLDRRRAIELAAAVPPLFQPGTDYAYSNTGYLLLADVVAAASGLDFGTFLRQRLFGPLGMDDTDVIHASRPSPRRAGFYAVGSDGVRDGEWRSDEGPGAWGVRSTLRDLERWHRALLDDAAPVRAVRRAMEETATLAGGVPIAYAAGLFVGTYRGARTVRHGGRGNIEFLRFSDIGGAVAVLCARDDVDAELIAERVADLVFADRLAPLRPVARVEDNRDLVGEYVAESGRQLTIIEDKGTLVLSDWGPIRTLEDGGLTASPTDELLLRRTDSGLRAQYSSGRPVDFERAVLGLPYRTEPGMLSGIYAHPQLQAILRIEEGDGSAVMTFAGGRRVELKRLTPGLFTAGRFRIRAVEATGKPAPSILLRTWRTPELTFSRLATP